MLLGKDSGGNENGNLFSAHHSLEGSADGDFGFAETNVMMTKRIAG